MTKFDKLEAFVAATNLHAIEGMEFGMSMRDVAKVIFAYGIAIYVHAHGTPASIEALRKRADELEGKRG